MDCSPSGSSVHRILQERTLEWIARPPLQGIFSSQGLKPCLIMSPALQAGFLPLGPPGKPEHTEKDLNWMVKEERSLWVYLKWEMFPALRTAWGTPQGKLHCIRLWLGHLSGEAEEQGDCQGPCYNSGVWWLELNCASSMYGYISLSK